MTATNMCSNFGGKWDSQDVNKHAVKKNARYHVCLRYVRSLSDAVLTLQLSLLNCTDLMQQLDHLSVSKAFNDKLPGRFAEWYAQKVTKQLGSGM